MNRTRGLRRILSLVLLGIAAATALSHAADPPRRLPASPSVDSLLVAPSPPPVHGTLTMEDAMRLALRHHPALAESAWRIRSAQENRREVSRLLNPSLDVTAENFGGDLGSDRLETTISATQTFELGGARGARAQVAENLQRLAEAELSGREREILFETGEAFLDAWWLDQRLRHLRRFEQIAAATIDAARERTRIGAAPAVEGLRAQSVLGEREVERRGVQAELASARRRLALQWGAAEADFDSLALPRPPEVPRLPSADELFASLEQHPERLAASAEAAVASARVREARATRIPDLGLQGGVRRFEEDGGVGFVAGASLMLPLWNAHGGLVGQAQAEESGARAHEQAVRRRLQQELRIALDRLTAASERDVAARERLLPAARDALEQLQRGYRLGRFSYLDQLEGQRAAVEAELTAIETERELWSARLDLERLLGRTLEEAAEGR